ncbi:hypothetical protein ASF98_02290 [Arthrobacter sp. Leaf337]|uniref:hypothetical protein n=1 Tax=Arthrobacter sp. Leaf337 TaxID=1736342 RepID=UPI0007001D2C|nr:hypothetical protein [Arthrobacter sp. Leaf337]KQR82851.1 hypothetical protein ASF98_02290 [Arthrobacter sp. Leaf337]
MEAFLCIIIAICVTALIAYLVAADFWNNRMPSRQAQIARIKREADETVARLDASYHHALRAMRRHRR